MCNPKMGRGGTLVKNHWFKPLMQGSQARGPHVARQMCQMRTPKNWQYYKFWTILAYLQIFFVVFGLHKLFVLWTAAQGAFCLLSVSLWSIRVWDPCSNEFRWSLMRLSEKKCNYFLTNLSSLLSSDASCVSQLIRSHFPQELFVNFFETFS